MLVIMNAFWPLIMSASPERSVVASIAMLVIMVAAVPETISASFVTMATVS